MEIDIDKLLKSKKCQPFAIEKTGEGIDPNLVAIFHASIASGEPYQITITSKATENFKTLLKKNVKEMESFRKGK